MGLAWAPVAQARGGGFGEWLRKKVEEGAKPRGGDADNRFRNLGERAKRALEKLAEGRSRGLGRPPAAPGDWTRQVESLTEKAMVWGQSPQARVLAERLFKGAQELDRLKRDIERRLDATAIRALKAVPIPDGRGGFVAMDRWAADLVRQHLPGMSGSALGQDPVDTIYRVLRDPKAFAELPLIRDPRSGNWMSVESGLQSSPTAGIARELLAARGAMARQLEAGTSSGVTSSAKLLTERIRAASQRHVRTQPRPRAPTSRPALTRSARRDAGNRVVSAPAVAIPRKQSGLDLAWLRARLDRADMTMQIVMALLALGVVVGLLRFLSGPTLAITSGFVLVGGVLFFALLYTGVVDAKAVPAGWRSVVPATPGLILVGLVGGMPLVFRRRGGCARSTGRRS
jgi:hypothetical protein